MRMSGLTQFINAMRAAEIRGLKITTEDILSALEHLSRTAPRMKAEDLSVPTK